MYKKILYLLTAILILVSLYFIENFVFQDMGLVELVAVCAYFSVFLYYNQAKDKLILLVFLLLIVTDILGLFYEINYISKIIPIIRILIYLILAKRAVNKLQSLKGNKYMIIFFSVIIALNILLIYKIIWGSETLKHEEDRILFFLYGVVLIIICSISVNYNFRYNTKRSMYFLYIVIASIVSDTSWFIAYFLDREMSYYVDTIAYIISLLFIVKYAVETDKKEDEALVANGELK